MKNILNIFLILSTSMLFLSSCKVEPKEINYGHDHCLLCDMTVVDKSHAAQYVTKKGRAYMFDAVECLVNQVNKSKNERDLEFMLVADYGNPGELVDAKNATYLICPKIKSPMGANLSAFNSRTIAERTREEHGGELFTWEELKVKIKMGSIQ